MYLKIIAPFIPIIMSFFPIYLIKLLLEGEIRNLILRIKRHWEEDSEPISPLLVNFYWISFKLGVIRLFKRNWSSFEHLILSPTRLILFGLLMIINTVLSVFVLFITVFRWYPYWIIKLYYYIFSKDILKFEPTNSDEWQDYLFLNFNLGGVTDTVQKAIVYLFLTKTNVYSYYASYAIIYHSIGKFFFFLKKPSFISKIVLFFLIFLLSLTWLLLICIFLPIYYILIESFKEAPSFDNINWEKLVMFEKTTIFSSIGSNFGGSYTSKYRKLSIRKTNEKIFNVVKNRNFE